MEWNEKIAGSDFSQALEPRSPKGESTMERINPPRMASQSHKQDTSKKIKKQRTHRTTSGGHQPTC